MDGYYHVRAFDYMSDGRILLLGQQTYIDVLVENASHHASAIYPGKRALQKKSEESGRLGSQVAETSTIELAF